MTNGQAFILHIWDAQDVKVNMEKDNWGDSFQLINYLTHNIGVTARGMMEKMEWLAYVDSF